MSRATGYRNLSACECENEVLRARLAELRAQTLALCDAVESYVHQGMLRSSFLIIRDKTAEMARGGRRPVLKNR